MFSFTRSLPFRHLLSGGAIALAAIGFASPAAYSQVFTYSGTTTGGPTWNRPLGGTPPTGLSGVGTATPYSTFQFQIPAAGNYSFLSTSTTTGYDNFVALYRNSFNASTPLVNAVIANDDFPTIGLSGFNNVPLTTGTEYFLVTTGFNNADFGTFTNSITGPGTAFATPAPSSAAVMALGGMMPALALVRRRRRK